LRFNYRFAFKSLFYQPFSELFRQNTVE